MKFTLILPAYNEANRLPDTLKSLAAFSWPAWVSPEVLVVLDGCTDGTREVVDAWMGKIPGLRYLDLPQNQGKGAAVRTGMLVAGGEWVAFTDADESYPFAHHLPLLLEAARGDAPVVIGSRKHPGSSSDEANPPMLRRLMSAFYSFLCQAMVVPGIKDAQAGLKMFRRDAARALFAQSKLNGFGFDTEILFLARRIGYRIAEIPVSVRHVPESRVHPIRDSLRMISNLITIRTLHRRTGENSAALMVGAAALVEGVSRKA